jgi:beta-glucanase (GH16 family)
MHWQVTGASLRFTRIAGPARASGPATTVVSFAGAANSSLDARQWSYEATGKGSTDLQTYTVRPTNAALDGAGHLVLTARRENTVGADKVRRAYTSARVTTLNKVTIKPGSYVETEIQAPVGVGVRPAFALVGTSISRVGWPAAGELDVLGASGANETVAHLPSKVDPRKDAPYTWGDVGDAAQLAADGKAHRYGVYFDGKTVRFYVDRRERMALWAEDAVGSGRSWPFGAPQYLMLTVAVGGADPAHTTFPQQMTVGAISVWSGGVPF